MKTPPLAALLPPKRGRGNHTTGPERDTRHTGALKRQRAALTAVVEIVAGLSQRLPHPKDHYTVAALLGGRKTKALSRARCLAIAIGHELSGASEPETAHAFRRKNHNSVRHARKVWVKLLADPATKAHCLALRANVARQLEARTGPK